MALKNIVNKQYRNIANKAAQQTFGLEVPSEGWLAVVRKALGMSVVQLAKRRGVTRNQISKLERTELQGAVTLRTMQNMAEAMDCRFVYAVVPRDDVETLIDKQARKKALKLVSKAGQHMALEAQSLSNEQMRFELDRLTQELKDKPPTDFWED
ncbi:MAG: transcriptional regulator [Alphaproteobacteria bacterium]|nr:MAG: transcriptional regulator [Alphaproteobacteria bacterium]